MDNDFRIEAPDEGFVNARFGFAQMGIIREEVVPLLGDTLVHFQRELVDWEQFEEAKSLHDELARLRTALSEELAVIIHRRIVPGRCKYCPV